MKSLHNKTCQVNISFLGESTNFSGGRIVAYGSMEIIKGSNSILSPWLQILSFRKFQ